jgi:hypothetical protein
MGILTGQAESIPGLLKSLKILYLLNIVFCLLSFYCARSEKWSFLRLMESKALHKVNLRARMMLIYK